MKRFLTLLVAAVIFFGAGQVFAGTVSEYSADIVNVKSGKVVQKFYVSQKKMRTEGFDKKGKLESMAIVHMDKKKMYIFMVDTKTYMEMPFAGDKFDFDAMDGKVSVKEEKMGTEVINGYNTTKYKNTVKMEGRTSTEFNWMAPEFDIPMRTQNRAGTEEMRNIKKEKQKASLFEIPGGYKRDKNMEQMMRGMPR